MAMGGRRKGAGRKTQWASGCGFSETITIRVPKILKDKLLKIAHRLDAGEEVDLVSKSIIQENQELKQEIAILKSQLDSLPQRSKDLLFDLSLVRKKDRSAVKKCLAALLDIEKTYFNS